MITVLALNSALVSAAFFGWVLHVLLAQVILQKHLIELYIRRMKKILRLKFQQSSLLQNQLVSIGITCGGIRSFHLSVPHFSSSTTSSSFVFLSLADMSAILSCHGFMVLG